MPEHSKSTNSDQAKELADLKNKVEALSSLIEISIIINSALDLDDLIVLVMEKAQEPQNVACHNTYDDQGEQVG